MKNFILLLLIIISAVYFLGCVLPDTGNNSGDTIADYATYSEALGIFPSFSSNLFNPSVQSGS